MNYSELTAKQLQELCRERSLDTARDKATMIKRLTEDDAAKEIEKFYGGESAPLPDGVLPASEDEQVSADPEPTPEPSQAAPELPYHDFWVTPQGGFTMRFDRHGKLDEREHRHNLHTVKTAAEEAGFSTYGPPFRVKDPDPQSWVYRINVR